MTSHVVITGHVQGVGYRAWVRDEAKTRGLRGWVRNRRDGSVEAVFDGDTDVVAAAVAACRNGPPLARVDSVIVHNASDDELKLCGAEHFVMLPTL